MIENVSGGNTVYAAKAATQSYQTTAPEKKETPDNRGEAVIVDVSENATKAKKLITELGPITLDPAVHLQKAEIRLKELMNDWGIPETTDMEIHRNKDGTFKISGDHPLLVKIEESLNDGSERELANSFTAAHSGSIITRIGEAVGMAMRGADQNPAMTDTYYNWVKNTVAAEAKSMDYAMTFSNGNLSGSLVNSEGVKIAIGEGLSLPTA